MPTHEILVSHFETEVSKTFPAAIDQSILVNTKKFDRSQKEYLLKDSYGDVMTLFLWSNGYSFTLIAQKLRGNRFSLTLNEKLDRVTYANTISEFLLHSQELFDREVETMAYEQSSIQYWCREENTFPVEV
jgi:hypothetical protein